jgi:hypothetical protein
MRPGFSSGIIERNGFVAAAQHLIMAEPPVVRSDRAIPSRNGLNFPRYEKNNKHLQWFILEFGVSRQSLRGPLAGTQTYAVTL